MYSFFLSVSELVGVYVCVCACVRACVCVYVHLHMCVCSPLFPVLVTLATLKANE